MFKIVPQDLELSVFWEITNFKSLQKIGKRRESPKFWDLWTLRFYSNGVDEDHKDYLSFYLCSYQTVSISFKLYVIDKDQKKCAVKTVNYHSFSGFEEYGFSKFIGREYIMNNTKSLLPKGTLTLACTIAFDCVLSNSKLRRDLAIDFLELLLSSEFSDVELVIGKKSFPAHKCILAARSPVFQAMFSHEMLEKSVGRVVIVDIEEDVLKELLQFIYTGNSFNVSKMPVKLFYAADKYQLVKLKELCITHMILNVTEENALKLFIFAHKNNYTLIKYRSLRVLSKNVEPALNSISDLSSDPEMMKCLFSNLLKLKETH